ncbi:hypothetical protein THAOC_31574 [Thalassiosira oceanica]|uniref:ShKT domain-containing protein n=1 Tax=Thalassiosira oceanica TaxID=159749 RepID=K0RS87_THAOC|nr:hypothetical protein THAOC_31574 [Thalassiosira oceanica]|eukprot:EJK49542.1 hypothetical protein THAOC_31574 [Thalassiosira oceanica]
MKLSILLSCAVAILGAVSTSARLAHHHDSANLTPADYDANYDVEDFKEDILGDEDLISDGTRCRDDNDCSRTSFCNKFEKCEYKYKPKPTWRDIRNACNNPKNCNRCKKQCPSGDIKDACKELHCNSEDWLEDELEETMAE